MNCTDLLTPDQVEASEDCPICRGRGYIVIYNQVEYGSMTVTEPLEIKCDCVEDEVAK